MDEFVAVPCCGDFKARIVKKERILPPRVEEIWNKELKDREGKLFNGTVLGLVEATNDEILLESVEYKIALAKIRDPSLDLDFKPLGTSGMTISQGKVLIGQRSAYVSTHPNGYEMVPSGSVDTVDIKEQLILELEEEAGIGAAYVERCEGWELLYDVHEKAYEVVARVHVAGFLSESPIHKGTGEYRTLMWLTSDELEKHIIQHSDHYVPLTKHLYTRWREFIA